MKKVLITFLFGIFIFTGLSWGQTRPPASATPTMHRERHERFPEMHRAMHKLRLAKAELEKAAHDFSGHRVKAIAAVNEAMEEIRLGVESEKSEK